MHTSISIFDAGQPREVSGNKLLQLDDPETVYLVRSGTVYLFVASAKDGKPDGTAVHLTHIEVGHVLLGSQLADGERILFASGLPGTEVVGLALPTFRNLTANGDAAAQGIRWLEAWLDALSDAVFHEAHPARLSVLQSGDVRIPAGRSYSPANCMLWVQIESGAAQLLGRHSLPINSPELMPVVDRAWIIASEETAGAALTTAECWQDPRLWAGLANFHRLIADSTAVNAQQAAEADRTRLRQRAHSENRLVGAMLSNLAESVELEEEDSLGTNEDDPLLVATQILGSAMNIAIQGPRVSGQAELFRDPIAAIARASNVRTRRVVLREHWWQRDNGPMLAFWREMNQPVVLLPRSSSAYDVVDPVARTRRPLDPEDVAKLSPTAYVFYRPFPSRQLTPRDIIKVALAGTWRDWVTVIVVGLIGGVLGMLTPVAMSLIFGRIVPAADRSELQLLVAGLTVAAVVTTLWQFTRGIAMLRIETMMNATVEAGVWDRLLNLPASFFRRYAAGDLAMRAMGVGRIRQVMTEAVVSSLLTFLFSLVAFVLLFYYDARLALAAALFFFVMVAATVIGTVTQLRYERESYEIRGKVWGVVLQLLTGISRLRVAGAENRALAYWAVNYSQQTRLAVQAQSVANNLASFTAATPALASLVIFAGVTLLSSESISLSSFLAFNAAFAQLIGAAVLMSSTISSILEVVPLYERARPILEALPEFSAAKRDPGELTGEIEIAHVSFRYDANSPLVLDDVNLHIRAGEFVALVGASGSGKSTILRLLLGFEDPTAGAIYYGREDFSGLDHQAVRRQIGVVLQNSKPMPGNLLDNITGSVGFTLEDAWEAARLAGLADDINRMPMGMYTVITDGESTLSGGQRQRLMIARAIVARPKVLFFDEATSALDNVTQAMVTESLDNLKATRVVVAHRLSTVMRADRILVVDHGKVVQEGRYTELMDQPGPFADLARRQLA